MRLIIGIILLTCSLASYSVTAQTAKGKPFQELNALIDANTAAITENSEDIISLNNQLNTLEISVSSLILDVDTLETEVAGIKVNVTDNTTDIATALLRINANEDDLELLRTDLTALQTLHMNDFLALESRLNNIDTELTRLSSESSALASELQTRLGELTVLIGDNSTSIDALVTAVVIINAELTAVNTRYNNLTVEQDSLEILVANYSSTIESLSLEIDALKDRVVNLEGYHDPCIGPINLGDSFTRNFIGECTSAVRSGYAKYFTFTVHTSRTYIIDMTMVGGSDRRADSYLYLRAGANKVGTTIFANDDGGSGYNAKMTVNLSPGIYTIEATTYNTRCSICAGNTYLGYNFNISVQ